MVLMYAEGGRSRTQGAGTAQARPGAGLALEAGVPVVPVAIHGSEHVREAKRAAAAEGDGPVRRAAALRPGRASHAASSRRRSPTRCSTACAAMYGALSKQGRRGVLERLREERRHGAPADQLSSARSSRTTSAGSSLQPPMGDADHPVAGGLQDGVAHAVILEGRACAVVSVAVQLDDQADGRARQRPPRSPPRGCWPGAGAARLRGSRSRNSRSSSERVDGGGPR